jgi:hypothetical protein
LTVIIFAIKFLIAFAARRADARRAISTIEIVCRRGLQLRSVRARACRFAAADPDLDQPWRGFPKEAASAKPDQRHNLNGPKPRH